jgi:NitT/TauT family transport system substrate-binding protein
MNVALTGGDFRWIQLSPATMTSALQLGRVDAASMSLTHTYRAKTAGILRPAVHAGRKIYELFGVQMISSVNVSYPEKLAARPAEFREFNRLLKASADYMHAHPDEVYGSVGRQYKVDPSVLAGLQRTLAEFPAALEQKDVTALAKSWDLAFKYGLLKRTPPPPPTLIWSGVTIIATPAAVPIATPTR